MRVSKIQFRIIFTALILAVLVVCPFNVSAEDIDQPFVDLDGDGINDNIQDIDNNGIPDDFQSTSVYSSQPGAQFLGFSDSFNQKNDPALSLTLSESFKLNKFSVRMIEKCRSDFDSGFGVRIGFSGSSGGACAGGICF